MTEEITKVSQRDMLRVLWLEFLGDRNRIVELFAKAHDVGLVHIGSLQYRANPRRLAQLQINAGIAEGWLKEKPERDYSRIPENIQHWIIDQHVSGYRRVLSGLANRIVMLDAPEKVAMAAYTDTQRVLDEFERRSRKAITDRCEAQRRADKEKIDALRGKSRRQSRAEMEVAQ